MNTDTRTLGALEHYWMPFTDNRRFKAAPNKMIVAAKGMYYTTADGAQVLDGLATLSGLRIEALPDPSLPRGGPGRDEEVSPAPTAAAPVRGAGGATPPSPADTRPVA